MLISFVLLTTCPSQDSLCRQAQDSKQDTTEKGRNTGKGKAGEVEARGTIPAEYIPCRNYKSTAPRTGCMLQVRTGAVRNSAGKADMMK